MQIFLVRLEEAYPIGRSWRHPQMNENGIIFVFGINVRLFRQLERGTLQYSLWVRRKCSLKQSLFRKNNSFKRKFCFVDFPARFSIVHLWSKTRKMMNSYGRFRATAAFSTRSTVNTWDSWVNGLPTKSCLGPGSYEERKKSDYF